MPPVLRRGLPEKIGSALSAEMLKEAGEMGVLVDKDDQGVLLQVFLAPLGDRPTLFFEIVQRIGCETLQCVRDSEGEMRKVMIQAGGCGGFGKGNFKELFKCVERYMQEKNV